MGRLYPTDLTDEQWAILGELIPPQTGRGRRRTVDLRRIVDALLYWDRTGCQWRMMPREYGGWTTVRYYFDKWTADGDGARVLLPELAAALKGLQRLWVNGAYAGIVAWAQEQFGWTVEVVTKLVGQVGFVPQPKRWRVEQVFGSLGRNRRLARDYEFWASSAESAVYIASIHRSLKRLTAAT